MIISGGTLYGPTCAGGRLGGGTVFAIGIVARVYTNLVNFTANFTFNTASGYEPVATLVLLGNSFYGTTWFGGGILSRHFFLCCHQWFHQWGSTISIHLLIPLYQ